LKLVQYFKNTAILVGEGVKVLKAQHSAINNWVSSKLRNQRPHLFLWRARKGL
jgi:hypothetical protein